jgi:CelD/BcsL family acetyltransferase involved in cellulose biosynthesis
MVGTEAVAVPAGVSAEISSRIECGGADLISRYAPEWESLCKEHASAPFLRPEWIATYIRAFEPGSELLLLTANAGGKLAAVMPLVRKSCWYAGVPMVKLAGPANAHSVQFDIARLPGAAGEAAVRAIWNLLKQTPGWHVLQLPVFPDNGACQQVMRWADDEGFRTLTFLFQDSPILRMQANADGQLSWLGGTSRHFRHELRRWARLLETEAEGKPQLVLEAEANPALLEQFFNLEASGWKGQEQSAINSCEETRVFYDEIAREAAARGYFRLYSLEVNGSMVAGAFGVTTEGCSYPMKIAYNERLRRCGPGQVMFNGILEDCAAVGIKELFFGGDRDRYKTSWTQDTLPHFNGFVFAPGFRTQLAYHVRTGILSPLGKLRGRWRAMRSRPQPAKTARSGDPGEAAERNQVQKKRSPVTQAKESAAASANGAKPKSSDLSPQIEE